MTKHGDFCLPPKVLAKALIGLLLAMFVRFMGGWFTAWFAPMPMTMARDLTLTAIVLMAPAYFVKVFLKYGGEAGTLWTRIAGCLSSVMMALGSLGLAWGVGNAFPRCPGEQGCVFAPVGFFIFAVVMASFFHELELALKDAEDENGERINR
jgi:hypothetical protein